MYYSKSLGELVYSNFAILDFMKADALSLSSPAKTSATYILRHYDPVCGFTSNEYLYWGCSFATKIIVNIFSTTGTVYCQ